MGTGTRLLLFVIVTTVLVGSPAAHAAEEVDLLLVLASDASRSIEAPNFELQRNGYAAAIVNPRVIQAIRSGALGKIAISFVEWSDVGQQKVVIDWTVIRDEATAKEFSAQIIRAPRAFNARTSISGGQNSGRAVTEARDEAIAKGITINGLVISNERNVVHTNPPGGLDAYYRNSVIGGPGAFVMVAENFSSLGETILNKLNSEIAPKGSKVDTGAKDAGAMSKQQRDKRPHPVTHKRSQRTPYNT